MRGCGSGGNGEAGLGIVRGVVEKRETGAGAILEVDDVERGGALVEVVAVTARIEAEERAEEETDGRFVRDDHDVFPGMSPHQFNQRRQSAGGDGETTRPRRGSKGVGVLVPLEGFLGIFGFDLSLPWSVCSKWPTNLTESLPRGFALQVDEARPGCARFRS